MKTGEKMKNIFRTLFAALLIVMCAGTAYSFDDGFAAANKTQSRHFTVLCAPHVDLDALVLAAYAPSAVSIPGEAQEIEGAVGELDHFFTRVCDILDMQLYSYTGTIKVCRDPAQLQDVFRRIFGRELSAGSFYVNDLNTIYIDQQHFTPLVLGHEIAHAIMCHYFIVPPPEKVSEVLAGYVEYQLRKVFPAK